MGNPPLLPDNLLRCSISAKISVPIRSINPLQVHLPVPRMGTINHLILQAAHLQDHRAARLQVHQAAHLRVHRVAHLRVHQVVLGKFSLVWFRAIFARPETRPSGP